MAFHLSVKSISRSAGRSAAGAAAYISSGVAVDDYTGERFSYEKKAKPVAVGYGNTSARSAETFARALDSAESRKNSQTAREVIVALPDSATPEKRREIAYRVARWCSDRWDVPAMCAVHKPDRKGDQRNHHAHILIGTRDSQGKKVRILDQKDSAAKEVAHLREFTSRTIQAAVDENEWPKWSHLSLASQGVERKPTKHEGPQATALKRRGEGQRHSAIQHNAVIERYEAAINEYKNSIEDLKKANADEKDLRAKPEYNQEKTGVIQKNKTMNEQEIAANAAKNTKHPLVTGAEVTVRVMKSAKSMSDDISRILHNVDANEKENMETDKNDIRQKFLKSQMSTSLKKKTGKGYSL